MKTKNASKISSLQEFQVVDLATVNGGLAGPTVTVEVEGILDGVKGNTKVKADFTWSK